MEEKQALKCPRCDSTNTKFCYYNNYTKSQPRHYCRSCKKHWTKGGTLRNVTKNKKVSKRNTTSKRKKKKVGGPKGKFGEGLRQKMDDTQSVNHQKDVSFGGISTGFDQSHDLFDNLGCSEDVGMKGEIVGLECSSLFDHEMFSFQQLPCVSDKDLRWEDLLLYESFCVTDLLTFDEDVPEVNSAMDLKNEQTLV